MIAAFLDDAREWARGRMWIPRALLLAYLAYALVKMLRDSTSGSMFSAITLAFHEMGHVIFSFAGHFIGSLMGSGMQVLIPIVVIVIFRRQEDYFGMAVGGFWLSFALFELAAYVGDSRSMDLPLVSLGAGDPEHDWYYLLSTMGLLRFDGFFAFLTRVAATAIGAASLVFAVWLLYLMWKKLPPVDSRPGRTTSMRRTNK